MKLFGDVLGFFISYRIADSVFGVISWFLIIKGFARIPCKLKFPFTGGYQILLYFFLLQCSVMIVRGYINDYGYIWFSTFGVINYHLFQPTYILCYLMPFVAFIPIRYFNFRLMLNYSIIFTFTTLALSVVFSKEILNSSFQMAAGGDKGEVIAENVSFYGPFAFLTFLYYFIPKKKWQINLIGLIVTIVLLVVGARRGGIALNTLLLIGALYFKSRSKSKSQGFLNFVLSASLIAIFAYFILESKLSSYLLERGMEDTRSYVEEMMFSQMSTTDWIFGKGLNGRYYCPLVEDDYLKGWRYGIETGFYNLVLKGGYLLAITYVLLLFIPAYRGLFKSKNLFCKAGGFYMIHSLISMWPFGILQFKLNFFVIWMMIVCCMNNEVLRMTNEQIKNKFFGNI